MIKKLLSFAAVAALSFGFTAKAETLDILPSLNNAAYDAATKTITFEKEWSWVNWWVGEADYSQWDAIVLEFEPVDFTVQIAIEYNDKTFNASFQAQAGETKLIAPLNEGKVSVQQYAIQNSAPGTLVLKAAYLQNEENVDPSAPVVIFDGSQEIDWWDNAVNISVAEAIAAKVKAGDKLVVNYEAQADNGFKAVYIDPEWKSDVMPFIKAWSTYNEEYGTIYLPVEESEISFELTQADVDLMVNTDNKGVKLCGNLITVKKVSIVHGVTTGVENIEAAVEENAPVEYYNLQGVKVANPANGIYVVRQGNKVSKVLVK